MVYHPRRMSQQKRGTKRRRTGAIVSRPRRGTRTRTARVARRRMYKRSSTMSTASARAYFDALRWHHSPHLGVPDHLASYIPIKGVTRKAVTAPTGTGAAYHIFVWTPSQVRCMWLGHQADHNEGFFRVHFPFLASHTQSSGPSMIRPLRQSVALRNILASQDVNGYIQVLHTNHPVYFDVDAETQDEGARLRISAANHQAFREMIDQHPQTRTITNTELRTAVSIPIVPGTMSTYKGYHEWVDLPTITHNRMYDSDSDLVFGPNGEGSNEQIAGNFLD